MIDHSNVARLTGSSRKIMTILWAYCLIMAAMRMTHSTPQQGDASSGLRASQVQGTKWERSSAGTKLEAAIWKKHTGPQMVTKLCVLKTGFTFIQSKVKLRPPEGTKHKLWTEGVQFLARTETLFLAMSHCVM